MKHFVFHLPVLISEEVPDSETPDVLVIKDVGRQHMDVHVYAGDLEEAKDLFTDKLQILLGDDPPGEAPPESHRVYVGPV